MADRGGGEKTPSRCGPAGALQPEFDAATVLQKVRDLIDKGRHPEAFNVLLHIVKEVHPDGEDGILGVLDTAKSLLTRQRQLDGAADMNESLRALSRMLECDSLLAESGDGNILKEAFVDGSSVICSHCGDLVKRERFEAHSLKWCSAREGGDDADDDDVNS